MSGTHSLWSPSSAKRWRSCPGSVVMCDGLPDRASKEAAEGTAYHALAEQAIRGGKRPSQRVGERVEADGFHFTINEEDAEYCETFIDYAERRRAEGCLVHVEIRTDTSAVLGIPDQGGTIDLRICDLAKRTLEIRDLKFGRGVRVSALEDGEPNSQLGIYGISEWAKTDGLLCDWERLILGIHQPRLGHLDEVTLNREQVDEFRRSVLADGRKSYEVWKRYHVDATGLAEHLKPSKEGCRWCPRGGSCKVRANHILEMFK